jgi:hypothetical protein
VGQPSKKLEMLALRALKMDQLAKETAEQAKAAKAEFMKQCIDEDLFDKSTKAIGDVQTVFSDNRYFDLDTALSLVDEEAIKESTVEVVDTKLLKDHMTKIQIDKCMKAYEIPLKIALKVNDKDTD